MKKKMLIVLSVVFMLVIIMPEHVRAEKYEYDELNRVIKVTYDDGSYITYEYDRNGNVTSVKVHEAETSKKEEETTKKLPETTKQPQETTKKPQETTKKPQETTKKPQETTKNPQETTKKPQETTKMPHSPILPEEETTKPKPQITNPGTGTDAGEINYPVINHIPGPQAFDGIRGILEGYKSAVNAVGQYRNTGYGNGNVQDGNGSQSGNSGQNNSERTENNGINDSKNDSYQNNRGGNATNPGGPGSSPRQMAKDYVNRKFPQIIRNTCKFIMGMVNIYILLGR